MKGLPTGKEFEFRVVPFNAAGNGEPSDSTGLVKVQKPVEAPKISNDMPTEVNTVMGQPLKIRVPFTGSPPTSVELIKVCFKLIGLQYVSLWHLSKVMISQFRMVDQQQFRTTTLMWRLLQMR